MTTVQSFDVPIPNYVLASGFQHTRLIIEAYRAYWQGCNDGDAAWVEIPEPPLAPAPVERAKSEIRSGQVVYNYTDEPLVLTPVRELTVRKAGDNA